MAGFNPPHYYEELARELQKLYEKLASDDCHTSVLRQVALAAAEAWESGASVSLGHNRAERYRQQAAICRKCAS